MSDAAAPRRVSSRVSVAAVAGAYVRLTKPRIIELLLITTVPAMVLADRGLPRPWLVAATLVGGTLCAGGANAINQFLDRDIDEVMRRTRRRPLPTHLIEPSSALAFGIILGTAGFAFLAVAVNVLSAALATSGLLFYVFVYTMWLKRTSPQNIVIGGAAGAAPVLVGWSAVTGSIGLPALVLFSIVFLWTPPHFWALALRYRDDYASAGVPMLPVVAGREATLRQMLGYTFALVAASLALYAVADLGSLYLIAAVALGAGFVLQVIVLRRDASVGAAMRLFRYSITYLTLLFAAVGVDTVARFGT